MKQYLAIIGILVIIGIGYFLYELFRPKIAIYVDNGSAHEITVKLADEQTLQVPANTMRILYCHPGQKKLEVSADGKLIFNEEKDLTAPPFGATTTYLLNPDGSKRYWICQVYYGKLQPPSLNAILPDARYKALAGLINLLPPGTWIEFKTDYGLDEQVPKSIKVSKGSTGTMKTVLARISPADYDIISKAATREGVGPADVEMMEDLVARLHEQAAPMN